LNENTNLFKGRVLIIALDGWTDAAAGATASAGYIKDKLNCTLLETIDDPEYFDYLRQRPIITLDEHGDREFIWPSIELWGPNRSVSASSNLELFLLIGQEPALKWPYLRDEIREIVESYDITSVIMLGSIPAEAPHNRPIKIAKNSQTNSVRNAYGIERSNYDGRSGFLSVLGDALEKAGLPTIAIWAQVPHYVASMPSPKAALALVTELEIFLGFTVDHTEISDAAFEWERSVDDFIEGDEDLKNYIEGLEKARDESEAEEMNTDALAKEFERFLRQNETDEKKDES
jgi:PAC2 family